MTAAWLDDGDVALYHGSALNVLAGLPAASVQTCITSPPYWGLRDYGTGTWAGGREDCDHLRPAAHGYDPFATSTLGPKRDGVAATNSAHSDDVKRQQYAGECARCGARRVDAQLGLEPTPAEYVAALVAVFAEVWRVLRADGTLWLNLGDSYAGSWGNQGRKPERGEQRPINGPMLTPVLDGRYPSKGANTGSVPDGLKAKDLVGVPWRVAFALQEAGWYLRSDIVWSKPNPMPESVTDRPTKAHEYVFLLAKQPRYFFDADAIREAHAAPERQGSRNTGWQRQGHPNEAWNREGADWEHVLAYNPLGRNARSVWEIATQPTPEAHFATFPEALVRRCILAGSSERGGCAMCGAPWQRQTEAGGGTPDPTQRTTAHYDTAERYGAGNGGNGGFDKLAAKMRAGEHGSRTVGWAPSCKCGASSVPQQVLDPFVGSGTTALVARKHGRRAVGIDLSADYLAIAARRLGQQSLFATSEGVA